MTYTPEERSRMAREYFRQGYNCAQSVLLAFQDVTGLTAVQSATFASGFGGGMGRLREVCGAVSGMIFIAGALSPFTDPSDKEAKKDCYTLVQEFAEAFRKENGSIVCRELLGLRLARKDSPVPEARTGQYYSSRPCERLVGCAAEIVARKLNDNQPSI